jgi:translocation protein SEC63
VGDVATVCCQLKRKNLQPGEAAGPVHAPLFPEPKFEEWWLFLVEAGPSTRIIASERLRDCERVIEEKLRFQVSRPGKHSLVLHAMCDSYAGLDQKVDINFTASTEEEIKRDIFVHPDDMELDLTPTLFQQFMGELNRGEESEDEEEEEDKKKNKSKTQTAKPSDTKTAKDEDSDSDENEDTKKKGNDADDSDSDSSSGSD